MSTEPEDQINVERMSESEQEAFYAGLEDYLRTGASIRDVADHFNLHINTARRHVSHVKGILKGEARAQQKRSDPTLPAVVPRLTRAVTTITDQSGLGAPGQPIRIQGGRTTQLGNSLRLGQLASHPESGEFRLENIDSVTLRSMAPGDLIPQVLRVSPEMSRALYDFLRMANPGWTLKAVNPNTEVPHPAGQLWLDLAIKTLNSRSGKTADTTFNSLLTGEFVRGALFCEMVLSPKDAKTFVDIVTPDPYTVSFRVINDVTTGGQGFELVQGKGRDAIVLDQPTVKYVSLDPLPGTPYGTSPLAPGLFPCLFIITMFQDARRVVAQQGWPRLNVMIKVAELIETMPREDQQDPGKVQQYVQAVIDQVSVSYSNLEPDQLWVHADTVEFGDPVGAIGDLDGVGPLFEVLERMAVRALKSMPLLMGLSEGVSEANANRQWEVHVASIRAMQDVAQSTLSSLFTLYLEANGVPAQAIFKFKEMRAIEELRESQTMFQMLENAQMAELLGYYSHDEASMYAVGHPAAETAIGQVGDKPSDNPNAGAVAAGDTGDEKPIQGDDGAKKSGGVGSLLRMMEQPNTAIGIAYAMSELSKRHDQNGHIANDEDIIIHGDTDTDLMWVDA